jgi:hypothetical protein
MEKSINIEIEIEKIGYSEFALIWLLDCMSYNKKHNSGK